MNNIIEKLDSYEIMTNLLPGTYFCISLDLILGITIPNMNTVETIVIYYFTGLIINRIGSIIIKPILIKCTFICESPYQDYLKATEKDAKLVIMSTTNNYFRTLLAATILLLCTYLGINLPFLYTWFASNWKILILASLTVLFLFATRKQTNYIRKRVDTAISKETA